MQSVVCGLGPGHEGVVTGTKACTLKIKITAVFVAAAVFNKMALIGQKGRGEEEDPRYTF